MSNILSSIPKAYFDRFMPRPRDGFSSNNMNNNYMAVASGDFLACRAVCSVVVETHDYGTDVGAAAMYSGDGCTVTANKADNYEGVSCLQVVVDSTGNREVLHTTLSNSVSMYGLAILGVWVRCNIISSVIQYVIEDSSGNQSYWNITTNGTANTWQQFYLVLGTPDGNNGTNADLTDVVTYGYKGLDTSTTYLFDTVIAYTWSMNVWIEPSYIGDYFYPYGFAFAGGFTSTITAPSVNPRIDLVCIGEKGSSYEGVLYVVTGVEKVAPTYADVPDTPSGFLPLYAVYLPITATKIVEYHTKDGFPNDAYIYADLRRLYK